MKGMTTRKIMDSGKARRSVEQDADDDDGDDNDGVYSERCFCCLNCDPSSY